MRRLLLPLVLASLCTSVLAATFSRVRDCPDCPRQTTIWKNIDGELTSDEYGSNVVDGLCGADGCPWPIIYSWTHDFCPVIQTRACTRADPGSDTCGSLTTTRTTWVEAICVGDACAYTWFEDSEFKNQVSSYCE